MAHCAAQNSFNLCCKQDTACCPPCCACPQTAKSHHLKGRFAEQQKSINNTLLRNQCHDGLQRCACETMSRKCTQQTHGQQLDRNHNEGYSIKTQTACNYPM